MPQEEVAPGDMCGCARLMALARSKLSILILLARYLVRTEVDGDRTGYIQVQQRRNYSLRARYIQDYRYVCV